MYTSDLHLKTAHVEGLNIANLALRDAPSGTSSSAALSRELTVRHLTGL